MKIKISNKLKGIIFLIGVILFIAIQIIAIFINNNTLRIIVFSICGIIAFITKSQADIIYFIIALFSIIMFIEEKSNYNFNNFYLSIFIILIAIIILDLLRFVIYKINKANRFIKNKNNIEFLHYIVYKIIKKPT
ncbi:MAG: hypothetical protein ACK4YF_05085 [Exilispira sp.]